MEGVTCNQSIEHILGKVFYVLYKSLHVVTSDLHLAYFVSQGDLCVLYCAHKKVFTELCCV